VAVESAAGVALGDPIAMTASLIGLGALVLAAATLFTGLKWIGAVYPVWLAIKLICTAPGAGSTAPEAESKDAKGVFGHAAIVTAPNAKSIAFFIAFVSQCIRPDQPLVPQFAILIATFVTLAAFNALAYALLTDRLQRTLGQPSAIAWLARAGGATLIGMGILTAVPRRPVA